MTNQLKGNQVKKLTDKDDGRKIFEDRRNIEYGRGRILWGTATEIKTPEGVTMRLPEGWVLPGGARTKNFDTAMVYAKWIDENARNHGRRS